MANVGYATLQIIPSVRGIGNELRRQLVAPAGDAGDAAGDAAGGGFADSFKGALAAIGVAAIAEQLGGQFTEAFGQALEQGSVTKTLQGQLGSSGPVAARQGAAVGRLFATGVTQNFEQGAEAVRAIVSGGLVKPDATVKQLDVIGAKMVDVANTFGTDMGLQSQAVSAILKNKLAPDATAALDLITAGFQRLGPNSEDLLETFQEYSVQLRKLGIDANTAMGLFSQGIQGGARDTDIIADAFKEFSIRAVDMSESSQTAYESIGLNAEKMSLQIARGGKGASDGLQTVLDRLRAIEDPVKREAAAVGLFGTQAEDLGAALFKLDPGKAAGAFGSVDGAAAKLGKTLRSGPSHEIKVFTRTVKQGLVDFIGGQVLPILGDWGSTTARVVLPPLREVGGFLGAVFVPALLLVGSGISGTITWLREWGIWLVPLAILVGGLTIALNAQAIATGLVTAVFAAYRAAIIVGTAVTGGFAAAQTALNAVMALNPFVLVGIALVALGALLVIAWKRSETFRDIVMGAWEGIKTAASAAWTGFIKPAFDGFMTGLRAVGAAALWLWANAIQPAFGFISTAARILATLFVIVVGGPIYLAIRAIGAVAMWLWTSAIQPSLQGIASLATWLWGSVLQPTINALIIGIQAGGAVVRWLWNAAFVPAFRGIMAVAKLLWSGVSIVFGYLKTGARAVGSVVTWLWNASIRPAFNGIQTIISTVYNSGIKPVFDKLRAAVAQVGKAFDVARAAIKVAWDKVKGIAKAPVDFIVNTVYNKGIVGTWNKVAKVFGAPTLDTVKGFAVGGPVFGAGTETSDDVPAWLSRNEHVWTAREVRGAGGHGAVMALRKWAASGGSDQAPGFADGGGLFSWVGKTASKGVDLAKSGLTWLKDGIADSAKSGLNSIVRPLINRISGSASVYRDMVTGIPKRMLSTIFDFSGKADKEMEKHGIGGARFKAGLSWARTQAGKRYQWGGNGNPSWDCSGILSAVESVIRGQKPRRRWATGAFSGSTAPPGWKLGAKSPYMIGITNAGVGHTAGTLNGTNIESRGGDGVLVGSRARSYKSSLFTHQYGLKGFANGGRPRPGSWARVGERGPELMRFGGPSQVFDTNTSRTLAGLPALDSTVARVAASAVRHAATAAGVPAPSVGARQTPGTAGIVAGQKLRLVVRDREFDAYVESVADGRIDVSQQQLVQILNAGGGG